MRALHYTDFAVKIFANTKVFANLGSDEASGLRRVAVTISHREFASQVVPLTRTLLPEQARTAAISEPR